jgi:hypothetical protein
MRISVVSRGLSYLVPKKLSICDYDLRDGKMGINSGVFRYFQPCFIKRRLTKTHGLPYSLLNQASLGLRKGRNGTASGSLGQM